MRCRVFNFSAQPESVGSRSLSKDMRNFSIQTLALMMMIMLVYTATINHKKGEVTNCKNRTIQGEINDLKKIHDDAKDLLNKRVRKLQDTFVLIRLSVCFIIY